MRRGLLLLAGIAALLALALAPARASQTAQVRVDNFAFSPAELTVAPGTVVTFTNDDDMPHTVTSAQTPPLFRSPPLDTGERFERLFDTPGTYAYFCSLHPHMQGTIVVQ